ncbi:hypothetical protein Vadar_031331 [Vaccinium darrowii]|uniref:Uncharacterized protein n=1 Tax=Vaccinium darrowii TaxID=229202 RepID=A0ACB7Z7U1_9ERIC|nr:hypothetical protein Vadar_031331 [Vaccinium darrowii]
MCCSSLLSGKSFGFPSLHSKDVNYAMEVPRKSQLAFAAANLRKEEAQYKEVITSVQTAVDFSFQDVEGLLHLNHRLERERESSAKKKIGREEGEKFWVSKIGATLGSSSGHVDRGSEE